MAEHVQFFDINVKEDGVYLYVKHPEGVSHTSRRAVTELLSEYGVRDIDYMALDDLFKRTETELEIKISNNAFIHQVHESAAIEASPDRMEASIIFSAPINKGLELSHAEIASLLKNENIVPDDTLISAAIANKKYGRKIPIARGREPTKGVDGFLQFHFDRKNIKPKPKIMEDGTVNFKQLDMFKMTNRGDVLVTAVPPKHGVDGVDIYGNTILSTPPRPAAPIPRGKGTVLSSDGKHLIADVSGQLILQDSKINISPHLEIAGNVDNSTGNIDFNGQVTVRGNVVSGFIVKAVGNIEVHGVCEGATLTSLEGNIILINGVQGSGKAELNAAGDITAKFVEGGKIVAGGNVSADSMMKCQVKCDGSVTLTGKNGLLVGGSLVAGEKLTAQTIGSPMGTLTEVEVGGSPKELIRQKEMIAEFGQLKLEYEKCDKAVATLSVLRQKNQLPDDKKAILVKMVNMKMVYRDKMTKLQGEIDEITKRLAVSAGTVTVSKVIRPGVRITIGNAQLTIRDELSNCRLRHNGEKIVIGPNL